MKPAYAIYLLESQWSWDHTNHELATITVEGCEGERYEQEFEELVNPECDSQTKELLLRDLLKVAKAQNKCAMDDTPQLVRLYRVVDADGILLGSNDFGAVPALNLKLQLICEFKDNIPIISVQPALSATTQ